MIIFFFVSDAWGEISGNFINNFLQEHPTAGTGPDFDYTSQRNTTGLVGKTVHLICKVKNLGNLTVSIFFFYNIQMHL